MDFKEYDNETLYEVRLLDYCMHTLEKGMEFLEEKGIKSEFSFNKQNIFGTQFNEEFSFKTIKDKDKSLFNSIQFEEISVSYINSKKEVVPFTSYDEYIEDIAEKLATNGMKDRFVAIAEDLKENLYELSKNNESKYFNKKDFEKFEKKIDERLNFFDKKRETKKEKIKEEIDKKKDDLEMDM